MRLPFTPKPPPADEEEWVQAAEVGPPIVMDPRAVAEFTKTWERVVLGQLKPKRS